MRKIELMKCNRCKEDRLSTKSGICLKCEPIIIHGVEVKIVSNSNIHGKEIKSNTGKIAEAWFA